jgi:hypothetical protein
VVHRIPKLPPSAEEIPGEVSNLVAFVLHPSFAAAGGITLLLVLPEDAADPASLLRGRIRLLFAHDVGSDQRAELMLNELTPPPTRPAFAYTFRALPLAQPAPATVTSREFEFRQVQPGTYLVRGRIDGADSVLTMGPGGFSGPTIDIAP